jgi:hypothetical protein
MTRRTQSVIGTTRPLVGLILLAGISGCWSHAPVTEADLQGSWRLTHERWEGDLVPARQALSYLIAQGTITLRDSSLSTTYSLENTMQGSRLTVQSPRSIELLDEIYDDEAMTFRVAIEGDTMTWFMGFLPMEMYVFEREER